MKEVSITLLIGLPGSGKSTFANNQYNSSFDNIEEENYIILSSDGIRKELYGDESIQGNPKEVFSIMQKRALENLNNNTSVIYDATNMNRKDRAKILNMCPNFVIKKAVVVWCPINVCIERDSKRERTVGKSVIDKMVKRFQFPFYDEGFSDIQIVKNLNTFDFNTYREDCFEAMKIPHDNPHHIYNIYDHCQAASFYATIRTLPYEVYVSSLYHDIGKPYTKTFINSKGETTNIAHYYGHENVGAYICCGFIDNLRILWLISNHMEPFNNSKYYKNLPAYLKDMLDKLHECDLNAH